MKTAAVYILTLVLLAAVSCAPSHEQATLATAEAVMQQRPDSALALLQTLDSRQLESDGDRALYALLLSQAYDKNYIDLTDDSLISIAVNHYARTGDHRHAMLAHYYHGRIHYNAGDMSSSAISCIEAECHAKIINDDFYLGLIYRLMSSICNYTYNFEEELKFATSSYEHFSKTEYDSHTLFSLLCIARAYNNNRQFSESADTYKEIFDSYFSLGDTTTLCKALQEYAHVKILLGEYDNAKDTILAIINRFERPVGAIEYGHLGKIYAKEMKFDSAMHYLNLGGKIMESTEDSVAIDDGLYTLYLKSNDFERALKHELRKTEHQNHATQFVWEQAVVKTQRDYLEQKSRIAEAEKQSQRLRFILFSSIFISVIICASLYVRHLILSRKLQTERLNRITDERDYLEKQIFETKQRLTALNASLHLEKKINNSSEKEMAVLKQKLALYEQQSKLQQELILVSGENITVSAIVHKLKDMCRNAQTPTVDDWIEFEQFVSSKNPQLKSRLYGLCATLSDTELKTCLLVKCNFSPTEISVLLCKSREAVSSIRRRLYSKIHRSNGTPRDFDEFIRSL